MRGNRTWWLAGGAVALLGAVAWGTVVALPDDPHGVFMKTPVCLGCHETDREGKVDEDYFVKPITELCDNRDCHPRMRVGRSHPVNVDVYHNRRFPDMKVPEVLYVGRDHLLTCATCHDTHGAWKDTTPTIGRQQPLNPGGRPLYYKTYYLRIRDPNVRWSKLCDACHQLL